MRLGQTPGRMPTVGTFASMSMDDEIPLEGQLGLHMSRCISARAPHCAYPHRGSFRHEAHALLQRPGPEPASYCAHAHVRASARLTAAAGEDNCTCIGGGLRGCDSPLPLPPGLRSSSCCGGQLPPLARLFATLVPVFRLLRRGPLRCSRLDRPRPLASLARRSTFGCSPHHLLACRPLLGRLSSSSRSAHVVTVGGLGGLVQDPHEQGTVPGRCDERGRHHATGAGRPCHRWT